MNKSSAKNIYSHVKTVIRAISARRLMEHSQQSNVEIIDVMEGEGSSRVFGHRMVLILIGDGTNFNLIFKSHFNRHAVQGIASNVFNFSNKDDVERQVLDYMREFCNLTGGGIKTAFEKNKMAAGMSLPIITRGFDEIFSLSKPSHPQEEKDTWILKTPRGEIYCSLSLIVNDEKILPKLLTIQSSSDGTKNDGDLEFL